METTESGASRAMQQLSQIIQLANIYCLHIGVEFDNEVKTIYLTKDKPVMGAVAFDSATGLTR